MVLVVMLLCTISLFLDDLVDGLFARIVSLVSLFERAHGLENRHFWHGCQLPKKRRSRSPQLSQEEAEEEKRRAQESIISEEVKRSEPPVNEEQRKNYRQIKGRTKKNSNNISGSKRNNKKRRVREGERESVWQVRNKEWREARAAPSGGSHKPEGTRYQRRKRGRSRPVGGRRKQRTSGATGVKEKNLPQCGPQFDGNNLSLSNFGTPQPVAI
ncbi:AAEL005418-PA [Aedes aegypti]|uniref:AAEL005418-PA n=1 Tax=Aedes aegypti TaxID=7159 RepID=Q17A40_AEDAE|nr:AAEL005418-PA [Aedes aegypti]